jgi:hypothetical protein
MKKAGQLTGFLFLEDCQPFSVASASETFIIPNELCEFAKL